MRQQYRNYSIILAWLIYILGLQLIFLDNVSAAAIRKVVIHNNTYATINLEGRGLPIGGVDIPPNSKKSFEIDFSWGANTLHFAARCVSGTPQLRETLYISGYGESLGGKVHEVELLPGSFKKTAMFDRPGCGASYDVTETSSNYIGCFKDSGDPDPHRSIAKRDLNGRYVGGEKNMNANRCIQSCKGYKYAATQWGDHCFCGNSFGRYGEADNCDFTCVGNSGEKCGGTWANSVYRVPAADDIPGQNRANPEKPEPRPCHWLYGCS